MIQHQLKLDLRPSQARVLNRWLWHLTGVYNWAVRKIDLDSQQGIYWSRYDLEALLAGHGRRLGMPAHVVRDTARSAHDSWRRCFRRLANRPKMKGSRNRLSSVLLSDTLNRPRSNRITVPGLGAMKFHSQNVPAGKIKCGRIIKRASGWYLCLFIAAEPSAIHVTGDTEIGIDPGFSTLLTLSTGEKVEHPHELRQSAERLARAQRGRRRRLTARLLERQHNQRKDRNHKLSRRLVSEHSAIYWSKDNHRATARTFGKSVASAAHGQLRSMLAYKSRSGGRTFVEVPSKSSTVTCSACGRKTGPTGYAGLKVRQWSCGCGATWDRDHNAALNTLRAGRGLRLERAGDGISESAA